jgi:hypothetical protein
MKYWLKTIGVLSCKYGSQNMHDSTKVLCLEMIIEIMIRIGSLSLFENVEIRKDILPLFCLARIKYASWYVYDIYIIISYLRATVPIAENIVKFIYQSDNIFPYNFQATHPCINYISVKNKTLWHKRWLQFSYCELSVYIYSNIPAESVYRTYISHLIR